MNSRPKSKLPQCVACLFRIGWGIKRVMRHTGYAKTTVHRFAHANGLIDQAEAERKKDAFNQRRAERAAVREAQRQQQADARKAERESRPRRDTMAWYRENRDKLLPVLRERARKRYLSKRSDPEFMATRRAQNKAWREANKEMVKQLNREFWKTEAGRALRKKHNSKPYNRVVRNLRKRLREYVRAHGTKTLQLIGCSTAELRAHIERQFKPGMSWDNYGAWHVDHIKPCAAFDLTDHAQRCACFHFTNLQPLWAEDNIKKSDRLDWNEAA